MQIRQTPSQKLPSIRCKPFQKSSSLTGIFRGQISKPHYDGDGLLKKDFATIQRESRESNLERKKLSYEKRRAISLERSTKIKEKEETNINKLIERQHKSQMLHEIGLKRTAHTFGIPINPINLNYENNQKGYKQQVIDEQKSINRLVRSHKLQTCGNTGYNIINGTNSYNVEELVPRKAQDIFQNKLYKFYSKYKLSSQNQ